MREISWADCGGGEGRGKEEGMVQAGGCRQVLNSWVVTCSPGKGRLIWPKVGTHHHDPVASAPYFNRSLTPGVGSCFPSSSDPWLCHEVDTLHAHVLHPMPPLPHVKGVGSCPLASGTAGLSPTWQPSCTTSPPPVSPLILTIDVPLIPLGPLVRPPLDALRLHPAPSAPTPPLHRSSTLGAGSCPLASGTAGLAPT